MASVKLVNIDNVGSIHVDHFSTRGLNGTILLILLVLALPRNLLVVLLRGLPLPFLFLRSVTFVVAVQGVILDLVILN